MKFLLLALLALVAVATAVKPVKYRMEAARDLQERDTHYSLPCNGPLQYRCGSGECIQAEWECDTEKDCSDGSDERNCTSECTGPHKFQCANNRTCIASEYRCDGSNDCLDNSDENECNLVHCSPGEAKCANYMCVEQHWFCDGHYDCADHSDETDCPSRPACHNAHSDSTCRHLNETTSPICLDHNRAALFCPKFCSLCS